RGVGHRVADLLRDQVAIAVAEGNWIRGVMSDETFAVEGEADVRVAVRIAAVLPIEVRERARRVERAREEIEDRDFVSVAIGADINGHASVPRSGWRACRTARRRAAWRSRALSRTS